MMEHMDNEKNSRGWTKLVLQFTDLLVQVTLSMVKSMQDLSHISDRLCFYSVF